MHTRRRDVIAIAGTSALAAAIPGCASLKGKTNVYGLIGKMKVVPGQPNALISILIEGVSGMPGCHGIVLDYPNLFRRVGTK
jgi:hypothetical protein